MNRTYTTEQEAALAAAEFAVENDSFSVPRMMIFRNAANEYGYEGIGNSIIVETLQERESEGLELLGEVSAAAVGASFLRFDPARAGFIHERVLYGVG